MKHLLFALLLIGCTPTPEPADDGKHWKIDDELSRASLNTTLPVSIESRCKCPSCKCGLDCKCDGGKCECPGCGVEAQDPAESVFMVSGLIGQNADGNDLYDIGSGVCIDPSGRILTAKHVIERVLELKNPIVVMIDGKEYVAKVTRLPDWEDGIAELKIEPDAPLPAVECAKTFPPIDAEVLVVGYPLARERFALKTKLKMTDGYLKKCPLQRTFGMGEKTVAGGSSGGGVFYGGKLVGLTIRSCPYLPESVALNDSTTFAIPVDLVAGPRKVIRCYVMPPELGECLFCDKTMDWYSSDAPDAVAFRACFDLQRIESTWDEVQKRGYPTFHWQMPDGTWTMPTNGGWNGGKVLVDCYLNSLKKHPDPELRETP